MALGILLALSIALGAALAHSREKIKRIDDSLEETRKEAEVLVRLSKDLEATKSYYEIQVAANTAIKNRLGISNTWIYLANPADPEVIELLSFVGEAEKDVRMTTAVLHTKGDAMLEEIMTSRDAVVVEDARTDPRTNKEFVEKEKICTLVNVPMRMADRLVGCLGIGTFGAEGIRRFQRKDVVFIETVASITAVALDRLRQFLTRMQEQEENKKLVSAIESAGDLILVTDAHQTITYVNPAFEKLFGVERASIAGKPVSAVEPFKANAAQTADLHAANREWKPWNGKLGAGTDSATYVFDATFSPVGEPGKPGSGYVGVLRNVTGEEHLNRAKDYFVHVTAHELRTPLTKLNLCSFILRDASKQNPKMAEDLEKCATIISDVYNNFLQIAETTSTLTDLSSPRPSGPSSTVVEPILSRCVEQTKFNLDSEGRGVTIVADIRLDEDTMANISQAHFSMAIMEVLSNAVKYTPDGKTVRLNAHASEQFLVVEIIDEGSGIMADEQKLLFTPFFSTESVMKHSSGRYKYKGGGLGLGLTVANMIMDYYGGAIRMKNLLETGGMKFTLKLPLLAWSGPDARK